MSDEYIRKQDVLNLPQSIERNLCGETVERSIDVKAIESLEPADVVPVRHGKWKYKGVCGIENNIAIRRYKCSECREDIVCDYPYNFCPNCGAKMDKE